MAKGAAAKPTKGAPAAKLRLAKLIVYGSQIRQGEAWTDSGEAGDVLVVFESSGRMRENNRVSFAMNRGDPPIEFNGANIAQLAACVVRAAASAVRNGVCVPLSPESTELLRRLEAAVAQGDESDE